MLAVSSEEFSQRLHALLRQDRLALLIQLAEKWSQSQALPKRAALIEGEALLYLCQMDRAWTRFREVLEQDPQNEEALTLVIELFLRRGWPIRARKMIPRLRALNPRSPRIARLESRSAAPPIGPPRNANQVIQTASPSQLVAIAERFLCAGSQLKGQQLLELALRKDPQNMRARRLIWACQGDFSSHQKWDDLWDDAHAEDAEDEAIIEPTVNMVMESSEVRIDSFPTLFRSEDEPGEIEEEDEFESTRRMAFFEEFPLDSETEETRGFDGDTQVMDIVSQTTDQDDDESTQEPEPQKMDLSIDNDDDVIVFTQIDESQVRAPVNVPSGPIQVVEKRPMPVKDSSNEDNEKQPEPFKPLEPIITESKQKGPAQAGVAGDVSPVVNPAYGRYVVGLVIIVSFVVIGALGLKESAENRVDGLVEEAIMSAEYMPLNQIAKQLDAQISSQNPPVEVRKAYLGLVNAFLWRDFTHADANLKVAQEAMSESEVDWIPKAIDAVIASGEKDWESVEAILPKEDSQAVAYLRLEAETMISGSLESTVEHNARTALLALKSTDDFEKLPSWTNEYQTLEFHLSYLERYWYRLSEDQREASFGNLNRVLQAEALEGDDLAVQLKSQDKLSAIQYYRFEFLKSLNGDSNVYQTRRSVHRLDLNNPLFQMWVATDYLRQDQHNDAYNLFEKCARVHLDCLLGLVSVRITQDRLDNAIQSLEEFKGLYSVDDINPLKEWISWAEGQEVQIQDDTPVWLVEWVSRGKPDRQFTRRIDTPVQNYLIDVNQAAEKSKLGTEANMDAYLLWSHDQLRERNNARNAELVLDALRKLSEKQVYSGRQWNMIIELYKTLNYSEADKQEALKFYLQLKPNGKNKNRILNNK
ncbi:MAG: hypothetical protein ACON4U_11895 [Myxococcota bacterium]